MLFITAVIAFCHCQSDFITAISSGVDEQCASVGGKGIAGGIKAENCSSSFHVLCEQRGKYCLMQNVLTKENLIILPRLLFVLSSILNLQTLY